MCNTRVLYEWEDLREKLYTIEKKNKPKVSDNAIIFYFLISLFGNVEKHLKLA